MTFRQWIHGLGAAVIGAAATAGSAMVADPSGFNFTKHGMEDFAKLLGIPALFAAFAYLKQSPLPSETTTVTATVSQTVSTKPDAK